MNRILKYTLFALLFLPAVVLWSGCSERTSQQAEADRQSLVFTCPMHPNVVQDGPGICPICSMDLFPFDASTQGDGLQISEVRQSLANIKVVKLGEGSLEHEKRIRARLVFNPENIRTVSSPVAGRIERLLLAEPGVPVQKGQEIYRIFSEELSVLQQEYLLVSAQAKAFPDQQRFGELQQAAKQKLLLYQQSKEQIEALEKRQKPDPYLTYYAPINGIVTERFVLQGEYVELGSPILSLQDNAELWVEADIYARERVQVRLNQSVRILIPGWQEELESKISFINPAFSPGSQLIQLRARIPNPQQRWQAGQQALLILPAQSRSTAALTLPRDAVIRSSRGDVAWVHDPGQDRFYPRQVWLGVENADRVEVLRGLEAGERVVVSGTYLLNSEYILKKGSDPLHAH